MKLLIAVPVVALLFVLAAAPLSAQEATDTQAVSRLEVQPARVEVTVGDTARLTATAYGPEGEAVEVPILWFTSYEIGTIDSTGLFVAYQPGERVIGATAGGQSATVPVVIQPLPAARIEIEVPATTVTASSWLPLAARAFNRIDGPVWDAPIVWESSDPATAEVVGDFLHAKRDGTVTVTARSGDGSGVAEIIVVSAPAGELALATPGATIRTGDVFRLEPTVGGQPLPEGAFPRYMVTGSSGTVDSKGWFVAEEPGSYLVAASFGESTATVPIRVEERQHDRRLEYVGRGAVSYAHTGDLWVFDNTTYVGNYGDNSLRVFDISDPANPVQTDSVYVDARRVNDVKVNVDGGFAVMTREGASDRRNGIVILDISDPHHPTILSEYTETVTGGVHNTFIVGDLVYVVNNGTRDMHIIDVSDRENPREVGRWGLDHPNKVLHDIFIKDGIAYLSYWDDGLVILDLGGAGMGGTATEPVFVSRVNYSQGNTHVSWRWNDYVFVGDEIFPTDWDPERPVAARGYIHVFDVSDLENPVEVAKYEVPEAGTHNVWIEDDDPTLYIGYYQAGLRAVDVSGELRGNLYRQGREIDRYMTEASENVRVPNAAFNWGVMIHDGKIYSADFNSGLWVHEWVPVGDRPIS